MKKLYSGTEVPTTINTEERIFRVVTFDDEVILCNLKTAKELLEKQEIKSLQHYWNNRFQAFSKLDLKQM